MGQSYTVDSSAAVIWICITILGLVHSMEMMDDAMVKVLGRLEKRSALENSHKLDVPSEKRMSSITRETGDLIDMLLCIIKAKNVLEIGTSVGYSTLWYVDAVRKSGKIITIEKNQAKIRRAKKNFADAGVKNIEIIHGEALEILEDLGKKKKFRGFFDFVLIDADKENVIRYFDLTAPLLRRGGIIMTDNMLYPERFRSMMESLASHIRKNPKFKTITCPIGNGEEISFKI